MVDPIILLACLQLLIWILGMVLMLCMLIFLGIDLFDILIRKIHSHTKNL